MSSYELYASGFFKTNWMRTWRIRDHVTNVLFDRKQGIRFLLSVLSVVVDDRPRAKRWTNRKYVLALAFAFTFTFLLSEGKVSLYIGLRQLCANFWVMIVVPRVGKKCNFIQFSCLENRHHPEQHMKNACRFPRRHRCPELLLGRHFQGQPGRCVLDKHLLVRTCCHNRNLQRK